MAQCSLQSEHGLKSAEPAYVSDAYARSLQLEAEAEPLTPLLAGSRPILSCFGKGCMAKVCMVCPLRTPERAELP